MHNLLLTYIRTLAATPLTESEIDLIKHVFVPKKLRKKQYFLQAGEVCQHMGFVVGGPAAVHGGWQSSRPPATTSIPGKT